MVACLKSVNARV